MLTKILAVSCKFIIARVGETDEVHELGVGHFGDERQHLKRLAEAHVIRKARAEPTSSAAPSISNLPSGLSFMESTAMPPHPCQQFVIAHRSGRDRKTRFGNIFVRRLQRDSICL